MTGTPPQHVAVAARPRRPHRIGVRLSPGTRASRAGWRDQPCTGTTLFPLVPGQVGLLAFEGAAPLGMDVIGGRALYTRVHARLLRGYVLDALDARAPARRPGVTDSTPAPPDDADAVGF